MKKAMKSVLIPAAASLLVWSVGATGLAADRSMPATPKSVNGLSLTSQVAGRPDVPVLLSAQPGMAAAVARTVQRLGGSVSAILADSDFLVGRVPSDALTDLERSPQVRALGLDCQVRLDPAGMHPLDGRAPAPAPEVPSRSDPALSLKETRGEIRAPEFMAATGSDGSGAVIAILDTGVDPSHPALQQTTRGDAKLIDWQDFTGEGDVATTETRTEAIAHIPTQSGTYHLGTFREAQIPRGEMESDINRNGKSDDQFGVLVADSATKGAYDTVYIDLNQNGDFSDERPLHVYKDSFDRGVFGSAAVKDGIQQGVSFVITRIAVDGSGINIGYDGGQHGTHVAGIAAGNGPMTGVAPGAKIMAIKVLTSAGSGDWSGIVKGMEYAAAHGAQVINLSLGGSAELNDGNDPQSLLIKELAEKTGTLFSIAAGNAGPGLNTVGLPGVAGAAITSGAYISSSTWKVDYGLTVPQDGLWYFSSAGPRDDGGLKPNVVAPGTANSAIPTWAGQYAVFQGTSMAAPQTTGAAALLVGAARKAGLKAGPDQLRQALEAGARRLDGYGWYEQGHGLIQVDAAWAKLQQIVKESHPNLDATGLYARESAPRSGYVNWVLDNRESQRADLALSYLPGNGLTLSGPNSATLQPLQRAAVGLKLNYPQSPGLYDALLQARVPGQTAYAAEYLATVVVPHEFDPAKGNTISGIGGTLAPARYARHFVRVPAGTAELKIDLTVPGKQGRVRLMAYSPDGMPAGSPSDYAGAPDGPESQTITIPSPQQGVWEIDAYASHGSMTYGLPENRYAISVAARGVYATPYRVIVAPRFGVPQSRKVDLVNYYGDIDAVTAGAGFARPTYEQVAVENGSFVDKFFEVAPGTAIVRANVSHATDANADLRIEIYHNDEKAGGWVRVGTTTGDRLGSEVQVLAPQPGQYAVEIVGKSVPSGKTQFRYGLVRVTGGDGIKVADAPVKRAPGAAWSVPLTVTLPAQFGPYLGAVTVQDRSTGKVLAVVPVELK